MELEWAKQGLPCKNPQETESKGDRLETLKNGSAPCPRNKNVEIDSVERTKNGQKRL